MLPTAKLLIRNFVFAIVLAAFSTVLAATDDGQGLFEKRCTACHKLPDPGQPPPRGWAEQLELMAPLARLKEDQKKSVLDYLMTHSQQAAMAASLDEDRELFLDKCGRCHSPERVLLSPLQGESLRHVVNRMQNRSGTDWLSDQDVEQVLVYLDTVSRGVEPADSLGSDATPAEIFDKRCSACHTLERIFQYLGDDGKAADFWSHTVSRMRGKAPQWLSESEADEILTYLRSAGAEQQ